MILGLGVWQGYIPFLIHVHVYLSALSVMSVSPTVLS